MNKGAGISNREGDRRSGPRVPFKYEARVEVGTAILDREVGTGSPGPLTLYGHTRDLSPSGLGIVIPAADIGPRHSGEHLPARVKVEHAGRGTEVEVSLSVHDYLAHSSGSARSNILIRPHVVDDSFTYVCHHT